LSGEGFVTGDPEGMHLVSLVDLSSAT
jgi:hypothetical protein